MDKVLGRKVLAAMLISTALLGGPTTGLGSTTPVEACGAVCAETQIVQAGEVSFAYRSLGTPGATPLILVNRFRGTMDEWDPAFLDRLALARHVIIFDNVGVARTNGTASQRLTGWADGTADFIAALGFTQVDVLGFSFGGLVAQELTLQHPQLVRHQERIGCFPTKRPQRPSGSSSALTTYDPGGQGFRGADPVPDK